MKGTMVDFPSIRFGGDYNPEQWPEEVWDDDVRLMRRAGVTTATVGVFSWARLEPSPGDYRFEWLDRVMEKLHAGGIRVMLATATASPPAWLARLHPESLPVNADGVRLGFGSRQQYSPSSAAYREAAMQLVERLAERYGRHPALEAWHVGNEYGCHVARSYDSESAAAFRVWLQERYGDIAELNRAWGTAFWSQGYADFDEVSPPAAAPTFLNPTQLLDFDRFSSDALLSLHRSELAILRRVTPYVPVTTNFMGFFRDADYWKWAPYVDFVSDDAYPDPADPDSYIRLAASRDLMRSLGGGRPWLLMEQATSAVNWRPRNAAKPAGANRVHSMQAVARGADGILYFQWRQAQAGAEKFHSALVPHAGENTRVFREVEALGAELGALEITGATVPARAAIVFDWDSWRAIEQEATPTTIDYVETVLGWYRGFLRRGVTVDFVARGADLSGYSLVIAPVLHVADEAELASLADFCEQGGILVVSYQSGILDSDLHAYLGGYLGPLQQALGVSVEEFAPLAGSRPDSVMPGTALDGELSGAASLWQEFVRVADADVLARFADGTAAFEPAITRRTAPSGGQGWYVATQPGVLLLDALVERLLQAAAIEPLLSVPLDGVEAVRRGDLLFLINHTGRPVTLDLGDERVEIGARDVVIR